mgnify:CR=1 FL=1|tara:strand:- start:130 stop:921 length:792 start_codon:yes stop_codon:yes gene_type:complete
MNLVLSKAELKKLSDNPFKYNRKTTKPHIKTMMESINKWGVLRNPIIGKVKSSGVRYIADGQHLVSAAINSTDLKELECTVVDVLNEKELIHLIADLNTSSKSWGYQEFLNSWLNFGSDNLKLEQYMAYYEVNKANESTSLSLALIVGILCKDGNKFKTGMAELKDSHLARITLKALDSLKRINCPAHQLYGAKSYIETMYKRDSLDVIKLTERIGYLMRCKDAFIPSNREQFKHYLFGIMECDRSELKDYVYGKWILLTKTR